MMKRLAALLVFLGLLCGEAHATCSGGSLPFNLTNGTTADASQVMSNYNAIISSVNATCAGSGANSDITSLLGLTTALTAAQGGTNTWVATVASGGSANAQTVTTSLPTTSFTLTKGYSVTFLPGFTNTSTLTLAVNGTTATSVCVRQVAGATCSTALIGGEINTGVWTTVTYDGTNWELVSNQLQPAWGMTFTNTGAGNLVSQSVTTPARSCEVPVFANLSVTVSSNNLTVTLLNGQGATPSAAAPVLVCFPNATGGQTWVAATAATTFTANSGSTFGSITGFNQRFWVVLVNNSGTVNIGVVFPSQVASSLGTGNAAVVSAINEIPGAVSTTACNACTNATQAGAYYTTTAVSNTTVKILGYFEANEGTAGSWASTPTPVVLWAPGMKKAGDIVQSRWTSAASTTATVALTLYSTADAVLFSGACQGTNTTANTAIGLQLKLNSTVVTSNFTTNQPTASSATSVAIPPGLFFPNVTGSNSYTASELNMSTATFCYVNATEIFGMLEPANDNQPLRLAG
jgi:hypothetical protein